MRIFFKSLLFMFLTLSIVSEIKGQVNDRIIIPSPNAASLGMYGEVPISEYTGVPNILIPIYNIESGDIKLPVGLQYHSSGIKVAQESTWVGLGWTLNLGGVITRVVKGLDDFGVNPRGYFYDEPFITDGSNNLDSLSAPSKYNYYNQIRGGIRDGEPDIFFFNFGDYSGKFYFERCKNRQSSFAYPISEKINNLKIEYNLEDSSFVILDSKGYKYCFETKEETLYYSRTFINQIPDPKFIIPSYAFTVTSSWYLDKIESPNGNSIKFEYDTKKYRTESELSLKEEVRSPISCEVEHIQGDGYLSPKLGHRYERYKYSKTINKNIYLSKVTFNNGYILINTSNRKDIRTFKDNFFNYLGPQKIDSIVLYDNFHKKISDYTFKYGYFNQESDNPSFLRLKLLSFKKNGESPFLFKYNETIKLPEKQSKQIDHWGYFNGKNSQSNTWSYRKPSYPIRIGTLIPSLHEKMDTLSLNYFGANRETDSVKCQSGILKSITYPTGGSTNLVYESNTYSNFTPYSQNMYEYKDFFLSSTDGKYKDTLEFYIEIPQKIYIEHGFQQTIDNVYKYNNKCDVFFDTEGIYAEIQNIYTNETVVKYMVKKNHPYRDLMDLEYEKGDIFNLSTNDSIFLNKKGAYRIILNRVNPNDEYSDCFSNIKYKVGEKLIKEKKGGGLRIKEVVVNDGDGQVASQDNYF